MRVTQIGPYIAIREIARGGQGVVYLAQHSQLRHYVAVKVLLDAEPTQVKRFKQEARILSQISHPNLLRVVDMGVTGEYPYMVMEFIDGWDLKGFLAQTKPSIPKIIELIKTVARATEVLHSHNLVHRDIKPGNILVEKVTLRPVLADLGLAKKTAKTDLSMGSVDSRLSVTGEVMGTPHFMAPEQVDDSSGSIGPWTDIYSLGATLFLLLTGRTVYVVEGHLAVWHKLLNDEKPPHPKEFNPEIPDYLDSAIWAAIQKDPADRPQSIEEWISMLRPQIKKHLPKRRQWAPAMGAVGLGFSGLVAYFLSMGASPKEAKDLAKAEIRQPGSVTPSIPTQPTSAPSSLSSSIAATSSLLMVQTMPEEVERVDIEKRLDAALKLAFSRKYDESLEIMHDIVRTHPNLDVPYYTRGVVYFRIGLEYEAQHKTQQSRMAFQKCLNDTKTYFDLVSSAEDPEFLALVRKLQSDAQDKLNSLGPRRCRHRRYR